MADFDAAVLYTLENEGSQYSNNPLDAGGPTKYGITLLTLQKWRKREGKPVPTAIDVQNLTLPEAKQIYEVFYWNSMLLSQVADQNLAVAIFDVGVNRGVGTAAEITQRLLGVKVDGDIGQITLGTLNKTEPKLFLARFIATVQNGYVQIVIGKPDQIVFLKGWLSRSQRLMTLLA